MRKIIILSIIILSITIFFSGCISDDGKEYPIHLYISNQSSKDPSANITIKVDEIIKFKAQCWVDDSHNWTLVEFNLLQGEHTFEASESDNNVSRIWTYNVRGERWIVIDYWYKNPTWGYFTFEVSSQPVCFM